MSFPTIRTLAGASAPSTLDPHKTALLVIDFQNEYFSGKLPIPEGEQALANAKRLIARADADGMPVFHVQHLAPPQSPIFAQGSKAAELHPEVQPAPDHTVMQKTSVSVFATTDIDRQLKSRGVDTLVISGLMTHACVAGAARDAVPLQYNVIVVSDACATRDLDLAGAGTVQHAALHRAALASIDDVFGDIMPTDAVLGLPRARRA